MLTLGAGLGYADRGYDQPGDPSVPPSPLTDAPVPAWPPATVVVTTA